MTHKNDVKKIAFLGPKKHLMFSVFVSPVPSFYEEKSN